MLAAGALLPSSVLAAAMAGGSGDVRKVFIFTTTQNYFGLVSEPWDQPLMYSCPEVNNFLDDGNQMLLRVQRTDAGVSFSNAVRSPRPGRRRPGRGHGSPPPPAAASPLGTPPERALLSPPQEPPTRAPPEAGSLSVPGQPPPWGPLPSGSHPHGALRSSGVLPRAKSSRPLPPQALPPRSPPYLVRQLPPPPE